MLSTRIRAMTACALLLSPLACSRNVKHIEAEEPVLTPAAGTPAGPPRAARSGCLAQFQMFDDDEDGRITREEFDARPHASGDADAVFRDRDADDDGSLTDVEFCSGFRPGPGTRQGPGMGPPERGPHRRMGGPMRMAGCEQNFEAFDANHDGSLSYEEFAAFPHPRGEPRSLFDARDVDADGIVTKGEFCGGWRGR